MINKMKEVMLILTLALQYCVSQNTPSTDYPFLHGVALDCRVEKDSSESFFWYRYRLANPSKSVGSVQGFRLDISRTSGTVFFDTVGLKFDSDYEEGAFRTNFQNLGERIVAVGFPKLPKHWTGTLGGNYPEAWFDTDTLFLEPGKSIEGFAMMSKAPPGIRRFNATPNFNIYEFFPSIEDTSANAMTTAQMDSIREAVNYHGWTVGPIAPPLTFAAESWCDTIVSYKHRSLELGWIRNQGIATSLDQKLENARTQIVKGNRTSARNILQAFVNEVEALDKEGDKITSEAYALLKFNAEYLMSRL